MQNLKHTHTHTQRNCFCCPHLVGCLRVPSLLFLFLFHGQLHTHTHTLAKKRKRFLISFRHYTPLATCVIMSLAATHTQGPFLVFFSVRFSFWVSGLVSRWQRHKVAAGAPVARRIRESQNRSTCVGETVVIIHSRNSCFSFSLSPRHIFICWAVPHTLYPCFYWPIVFLFLFSTPNPWGRFLGAPMSVRETGLSSSSSINSC